MKLPVPLVLVLQRIMDKAFSDVRYQPLLDDLDGHVLQCQIEGFDASVWLTFIDGKVLLDRHFDGEADTVISGAPFAMMSLLTNNDALFAGEVTISGNASLGRKFKRLLAAIDLEWEERLSVVAGDVVTRKARMIHDAALGWLGRASARSHEDLGAWLVDETELLESPDELEAFHEDVDLLREQVDRFEARLENLERSFLVKNGSR